MSHLKPHIPSRSVVRFPRALLALALALFLLAPASADATIFWANSGNGSGTSVGSSANDGAGANQSFLTSAVNPRDVAANSTHVYWSSGTVDVIERANVDGTGRDSTFIQPSDCTNLADLNFPNGITVDATHVYWISRDAMKIGRAKLDGTEVNCNWISLTPPNSDASLLNEIAVDDQYVYWTQALSATPPDVAFGTIGRADKDDPNAGAGPDSDFIDRLGIVRGLAIGSGHIFWSEDSTNQIGRADLDGANANLSFISGVSTSWITVTDEYLYYTISSSPGYIERRPVDGSGTETTLVDDAAYPTGVAVTVPRGSAAAARRVFGDQTVGTRSSALEVTLTSTGDQALTIDAGGITLAGSNSGDFTVTGGTCVAGTTSLATAQACTVEVVFAPSSVGAKAAEVRMATNAGALSVSLSGTATPAPTAPSSPTGVTATAGLLKATVSWTAPSSDGGSAITSYTATANPGGKTCTATTTSCTITGLLNTTAYTFTVTATNAAGTSPTSTATQTTRPNKKLKMKKPRAKGTRITSAVRLRQSATITQTIRTTANKKACTKRIRATKKKTYTVTCRLNKSTRNALKKQRQTLTVTTTVLLKRGAIFQATQRIRVNKPR